MRIRIVLLTVIGLLAALVPVTVSATGGSDNHCLDLTPPPLEFDEPVVIDPDRAGGEPLAIVGQDGAINVSAHAGTTHVYKDPAAVGGIDDFAVGYTNQVLNWRSTDGGRTWDYIGLAGLNTGPHSLTSTGFSDPDYAMDQAGNIYNTEIDLANVAVFASLDDGQSYTLANPEATSGDRPWLAALEDGEVFLYVNTGRQLLRSTDHGVTWLPIGINVPISAKPYPDPLNPDDGLIGPAGRDAVAISGDDGASWEVFDGAAVGNGRQFFDTGMIVDLAGNAYVARAGGYNGPTDRDFDGAVVFNGLDRDLAEAGEFGWGDPVDIPLPFEGDAMWSWLAAGDDGRVAVSWLQNSAEAPNEYYLVSAYTLNGLGTTVTCPDGSTEFIPPQFSVAVATPEPVHVGAICISGTTCNASTSFTNGDRRMGDFISNGIDADGRLFLVSADTTLPSATGGPKPVGNPIFVAQSGGAPLYEEPLETRESRCLFGTDLVGLCTPPGE